MIQINRTLRLSDDQYYKEETKKDLIVLHHTVGGSAKSTFDYWQSDPQHIGTAYIVERDGTIFEVFDPKYWCHHIGAKHSANIAANKRSIGIEIASEGGLTYNNGKLYTFGIISPRTEYKQTPTDLGCDWRGYRYFDSYDSAQLNSVIELIKYLRTTFSIENTLPDNQPVTMDNYDYREKYLTNHKGICGHSHLRADKSDVHPLFPWGRLAE